MAKYGHASCLAQLRQSANTEVLTSNNTRKEAILNSRVKIHLLNGAAKIK
jgi:hypothetical protein